MIVLAYKMELDFWDCLRGQNKTSSKDPGLYKTYIEFWDDYLLRSVYVNLEIKYCLN